MTPGGFRKFFRSLVSALIPDPQLQSDAWNVCLGGPSQRKGRRYPIKSPDFVKSGRAE